MFPTADEAAFLRHLHNATLGKSIEERKSWEAQSRARLEHALKDYTVLWQSWAASEAHCGQPANVMATAMRILLRIHKGAFVQEVHKKTAPTRGCVVAGEGDGPEAMPLYFLPLGSRRWTCAMFEN